MPIQKLKDFGLTVFHRPVRQPDATWVAANRMRIWVVIAAIVAAIALCVFVQEAG